MEVKRLLAASFVLTAVLFSAAAVAAADNVVYESGEAIIAEQTAQSVGWSRELYTKCVLDADVQFGGEGAGITLINADGTKDGTSIVAVMRNEKLTMAASGMGSYIYYIELDSSKKYHLNIVGSYGVQNGIVDMRVDSYAEDGTVEDSKNYYMILMQNMYASSGVGPAGVRIEPNTVVEGLKMTELIPTQMRFMSVPKTVQPGSETRLDVKMYRDDTVLEYPVPISYRVIGEGAEISDGVLRIDTFAPEGTIKVIAEAEDEKMGRLTAESEITVVSSDIFTINNAVFNSEGTVLEELRAVKNYFYDGTAVFAVSVYDEEGSLRDSFVKKLSANAIASKKEVPIILDYTMPPGFESEGWRIEINVWSQGGKCGSPDIDGEVAMRKIFEENGGVVEWIEPHRSIAGMLNGRLAVMQIDNPLVFIDGTAVSCESVPHIVDDMTYIDSKIIKSMIE